MGLIAVVLKIMVIVILGLSDGQHNLINFRQCAVHRRDQRVIYVEWE
jgi:hypothetical protein